MEFRGLSLCVLPFTHKYKGSLWELFCGSASEVNGSGCYLSLFITINSSSGSVKLLAFCSLFVSLAMAELALLMLNLIICQQIVVARSSLLLERWSMISLLSTFWHSVKS